VRKLTEVRSKCVFNRGSTVNTTTTWMVLLSSLIPFLIPSTLPLLGSLSLSLSIPSDKRLQQRTAGLRKAMYHVWSLGPFPFGPRCSSLPPKMTPTAQKMPTPRAVEVGAVPVSCSHGWAPLLQPWFYTCRPLWMQHVCGEDKFVKGGAGHPPTTALVQSLETLVRKTSNWHNRIRYKW